MRIYISRTPAFWLLFSLSWLSSCNGQEKNNTSKENHLASFQLNNTVPISEYVVAIFEDTKGNLWMGTISDGAVRFDGKSLTYFSTKDGLCDNTVASIAEDQAGNLWFGTHNGASRFDGKNFTNFGKLEGLHGPGCKFLVDRKGQIWAGTNHGVFRFNGFGFFEFKIPKPELDSLSFKWEAGKIWNLMEDQKGNIWFARDGYGTCKFDGTTFTHFTKKDGLCSNNVSEITEDKAGNIWFGCLGSDLPKEIQEGGLSRFDGYRFTQFPQMKGLDKNDIYSVYADNKGDVWIGATRVGLYRYDGESFHFYEKTDRMDLTWSFGVQSILEDKKGTLWLGFSGGLFRFNGSGIVNVTQGGLFSR